MNSSVALASVLIILAPFNKFTQYHIGFAMRAYVGFFALVIAFCILYKIGLGQSKNLNTLIKLEIATVLFLNPLYIFRYGMPQQVWSC